MLPAIRTSPRPAAVMTAMVLALAGPVLDACGPEPESKTAQAPAAPPPPVEILPPPPVGRAVLLQAIDAARSAYASGQPDAGAGLAGRSFAIRQAFGCAGEAGTAAGMARWTFGPGQQTIDISLTPADWTKAPVLAAGGADWEAVEGYWLTRPWLRTDNCPAVDTSGPALTPALIQASAPSPPVSGLAAVFAKESSRVGRRDGKAFALTLRGEPTLVPPADGYRLVIEGRFAAFPDGRAIRCRSADPNHPPLCIAAAEIDRVAFEDDAGKLLKEWRVG